MPEPSIGTSFPTFPSQYGDKEAKRLKQLEQQQREMVKVYQSNFTDEAWAKKPLVEKVLRNTPIVNTAIRMSPSSNQSWDFGYNPEQARKISEEAAIEYKELSRRQKVTSIVSDVEANMVAAALAGTPMLSISQILPTGLGDDFNEDDKSYLEDLGHRLARASREDILSGSVVNYDPNKVANFETTWKAMPEIDPRYIMSTVALSKDLNQISEALKASYPPTGKVSEQDKADQDKAKEQSAYDSLRARAKELGIPISDKMSIDEVARKVNNYLAKYNQGKTMTLVDTESGLSMAVNKRSDNSLWSGDKFLGYEGKDGTVEPGYFKYNMMTDKYEPSQEPPNDFDMFFQTLASGFNRMGHSYRLQTETILPNTVQMQGKENITLNTWAKGQVQTIHDKYDSQLKQIGLSEGLVDEIAINKSPQAKAIFDQYRQELTIHKDQYDLYMQDPDKFASEQQVPEDKLEVATAFTNQRRAEVDAILSKLNAEHENWLEAHPELQPRAEWADGSSHFDDLSWYVYKVAELAPPTLTSLAVMAGTTALTGSPVAGLAAAFAVMYPLNSQDVYESSIKAGATPEQAAEMALAASPAITLLDSVGDIPILKATKPALMKVFKKEIINQYAKLTVGKIVANGAITFGESQITETTTEVLQQAIQNASAKVFNPEQKITEGLSTTVRDVLIGVAPFSLLGGAVQISQQYTDMKRYMVKEDVAKIAEIKESLKDLPLEDNAKEAIAFNTLLESEPDAEYKVAMAVEKANKAKPTSQKAKAKKVAIINNSIDEINKMIVSHMNSIAEQKARLGTPKEEPGNKAEGDLSTQELIASLENELVELMAKNKENTEALKIQKSTEDSTLPKEDVVVQPATVSASTPANQAQIDQLRIEKTAIVKGLSKFRVNSPEYLAAIEKSKAIQTQIIELQTGNKVESKDIINEPLPPDEAAYIGKVAPIKYSVGADIIKPQIESILKDLPIPVVKTIKEIQTVSYAPDAVKDGLIGGSLDSETGVLEINVNMHPDLFNATLAETVYHESYHSYTTNLVKEKDMGFIKVFYKLFGIQSDAKMEVNPVDFNITNRETLEKLTDNFTDMMQGKTIPESFRTFFEKQFPGFKKEAKPSFNWDTMSKEERASRVKVAGTNKKVIAKTWAELNDVEQALLQGNKVNSTESRIVGNCEVHVNEKGEVVICD